MILLNCTFLASNKTGLRLNVNELYVFCPYALRLQAQLISLPLQCSELMDPLTEDQLLKVCFASDGLLRRYSEIGPLVEAEVPKSILPFALKQTMRRWVLHYQEVLDLEEKSFETESPKSNIPVAFHGPAVPRLHAPAKIPKRVPPPAWRVKEKEASQPCGESKNTKPKPSQKPSLAVVRKPHLKVGPQLFANVDR